MLGWVGNVIRHQTYIKEYSATSPEFVMRGHPVMGCILKTAVINLLYCGALGHSEIIHYGAQKPTSSQSCALPNIMNPYQCLRNFLAALGSFTLAISSASAADVTWDTAPGTVGTGNSTATDPLQQVEEDQTAGLNSSATIFNRNIAHNSMVHYSHASEYRRGFFGQHAHDGLKTTHWGIPAGIPSATLEIFWGLATEIDRIDIYEAGSNIQAYQLEIHDGKAWREIHAGKAIGGQAKIEFAPCLASAVRLRIDTDSKGGGIQELEVYHTASTEALPRYGSTRLVEAFKENPAVILFDGSPYGYSQSGKERIQPRVEGTCPSDAFTGPVLRFVCERMGGSVKETGPSTFDIHIRGKKFRQEIDPAKPFLAHLKEFCKQSHLKFQHTDGLFIIAKDIAPFQGEEIRGELRQWLGSIPGSGCWSSTSAKPDAIITPSLQEAGKTYHWAGFRATSFPDTNSPAWLKYSGTKSVRSWASCVRLLSPFARKLEAVETMADFKNYKSRIRADPEGNAVIDVPKFLNRHHEALSEEFTTYQTLGIEVINATAPKTWEDNWHDNLIQWARTYTTTYYLAKNFDVAAHQYGNEPDWYFNQQSEELIAFRLMLVADAIHSAIADVNKNHGKKLKSIYSAPVLAGDFTGRTARVMMRNLRTRYDGKTNPEDLVQLFNRHRYSGRPHQNAQEVEQAKEMMRQEAGKILPQVFTEMNYSTGGHWARPLTTFTNDTPEVFTAVASVWGAMMKEQDVHGVFLFTLNSPATFDERGPFSNTVTYSSHREADPQIEPKELQDISYGTKNMEMSRLFTRGFHGSRPLLETGIDCSDTQYQAYTAHDPGSGRIHIWSVQVSDHQAYELEFDLGKLKLPDGAMVMVEAVSEAKHGEIVALMELPADRKVRIRQPAQSAMLLTVSTKSLRPHVLEAVADSTVGQGKEAGVNKGGEDWLGVRRHSDNKRNAISYLKFELPEDVEDVGEAALELYGQSATSRAYDGGFLIRAYVLADNNWEESKVTGENAPNLYRTVSSAVQVDLENHPVGHLTAYQTPAAMTTRVTDAVREAIGRGQKSITFMLIREMHWHGEHTDDAHARLASREAGITQSPKLRLFAQSESN